MTLNDIIAHHLKESKDEFNTTVKRAKHLEMHDYLCTLVDALKLLQSPA